MNCARLERLESRVLLSDAPPVSIHAKQHASETDPNGAGIGQFTVRRTGDTSTILDVNVRFSPGSSSASAGQDIQHTVTKVRIARGRSYAHFNVTPIDDALAEPTELIVMKLMPGEYTIDPRRPAARIELFDNETTVGIFASKPNASETDPTGTGKGQFKITRTGPLDEPLEVRYYTRHTSTAVNSRDFLKLSGSVTIPAGQRNVFFDLIPIDDEVIEGAERVTLTIRESRAYVLGHHTATVTIADNDESIAGWWDDKWGLRVPLSVNAGAYPRKDHAVQRSINFTQVLSSLGRSGALNVNSLRVVETSADGKSVIDANVPFQFDRASNFNSATNASGNLVLILTGDTAANATRHYHVYFDTRGGFAAANVPVRVTTTDNVIDEGLSTIRIATSAGTYFYHKAGGAFTSLVDAAGNDWISYNDQSDPGSAGIWRGLFKPPGGSFHPGMSNSTTTIVSKGPLKTTIESSSEQGARRVRWEFYPTYARATVLSYDIPYWFCYEGTPGGAIDSNDYVVRSDGTRNNIFEFWDDEDGIGSENAEEWAYFGDEQLNRFLFLTHDQPDNLEDSYYNLDGNMTVFGFGRHNNPGSAPDALLSGVHSFTIGLREGGAFDAAAVAVNGAYRAVNSSESAGQTRTGR